VPVPEPTSTAPRVLPPLLLALFPLDPLQDPAPRPQADLIPQGRQHLDRGELDLALALFERADAQSQGTLPTRMWVWRTWLEQGRINDALDAIDELRLAGTESPDLDYLYGIAFFRKGKQYVDQDVPPTTTGLAFEDARTFLSKATAADPDKYYDAFLPLAESAWHTRRYEVGRAAALRAIEIAPADPHPPFVLSLLLFQRFVDVDADEARRAEADALWEETVERLGEAARKLGAPGTDAQRTLAADIGLQLGYMYEQRQKLDLAGAAFADSLGWNPAGADYADLHGRFPVEQYRSLLREAERLFVERYGAENVADALLLWWLGYTSFELADWAACEAAFEQSVRKWPLYVDSWFYVGFARFKQAKLDGAADALLTGYALEPAKLVSAIEGDPEPHLGALSLVIDWCAKRDRTLDAAYLCDLRTGAFAGNWEWWNDQGLLFREAGKLFLATGLPEDAERAPELFERSYEAYVVALSLAPDKPHLVNDTAVILHYFLGRDLARAREMYLTCIRMADELLQSEGLDDEERARAAKARSDAIENVEDVEARLRAKKR